jgi:protein-tyrosine kinase
LAEMGMVTPDRPRSAIAEEYRVIKRPVLKNILEAEIANSRLIMVTSSLPGEGKSFTAINLAISIAMELDHTVLLVDADVSKPSILKIMGLQPERGLMDVLSERNFDLSSSLLKSNIPKLSILPAGMPHERATELLASEAMARLLEDMASRYSDRVIIFDSPPLIPTTEARVLATHMGQIVMVVEAGRTTNGALRQALSTIESCPIKLMMLNKAAGGGPGGYYGYGYGYGYGQAAEVPIDAV